MAAREHSGQEEEEFGEGREGARVARLGRRCCVSRSTSTCGADEKRVRELTGFRARGRYLLHPFGLATQVARSTIVFSNLFIALAVASALYGQSHANEGRPASEPADSPLASIQVLSFRPRSPSQSQRTSRSTLCSSFRLSRFFARGRSHPRGLRLARRPSSPPSDSSRTRACCSLSRGGSQAGGTFSGASTV